MFDRRLAGPGTQRLSGLAKFRVAAAQRAKDRAAQICRRRSIAGGKDDFDSIAGCEEHDLCAERGAQLRQARFDVGLGNGKARDVLDACVAI